MSRTFEETHPWIKFPVDLSNIDYLLWTLIGEVQSKCEHLAGVPLLPDVAKVMHQVYLAKGALATTAIEGNTLTEDDVLKRMSGELKLPPSQEYLGQEIDNIISACNYIMERIIGGKPPDLTPDEVAEYNRFVLKDLPLDEDVIPGEIRPYRVTVGRYLGAPPEDCEYLLERLCNWLNTEISIPKNYEIAFGILKAIISHLYIAWIHPFGDGNGRTARLMELQILLSVGVPSTAAHLLSNHYNKTRQEYYRHLDIASRSGGDVVPFLKYALQGFIDGLREQIDVIRRQQFSVHWTNHVYNVFRNKDGVADHRRRRLVLDLTEKVNPIPIAEIPNISSRVATAYANKTRKTLNRDIRLLEEMELITKSKKGISVNRRLILAFLPRVRPNEE